MQLCELNLRGFRNYDDQHFSFDPGVNLIVGRNAQGKTNLLESIAFLGSGKSFRAQKTAEMIGFSRDFGELEGVVQSQDREQTLRWVLFPGGRPPAAVAKRGEEEKRFRAHGGAAHGTLLPGGSDDPQKRRRCPAAVCGPGALRPAAQLRGGPDGIRQNPGAEEPDSEGQRRGYPFALHIAGLQYPAVSGGGAADLLPGEVFEALGKEAAVFHDRFSGGSEAFSLEYKTVSTVSDPFAPVSKLTEDLNAHLEAHYRAELQSGQCLTGPHKDDFTITLSGIDLKAYGSQGQTRTAAISLKLAQRKLMKREFGEEPLLLLDDVLSELDEKRQDFVLNQISTGQVFITCCEPGRFTSWGRPWRSATEKRFRIDNCFS